MKRIVEIVSWLIYAGFLSAVWWFSCLVVGQPSPALVAPAPTKVTFDWWYPTAKLTTNGGQIFELVASPENVGPLTNWPVVATFPGNITNGEATIYTADGHYTFGMSVSNIYGKVFFSNLVSLPYLPDNGILNPPRKVIR